MIIRPTQPTDLPQLMQVYDCARSLMAQCSNPHQWIAGYPSEQVIRADMERGASFVCESEAGELVGTFCFLIGHDPTYDFIENGAWLNDEDVYGTIHRLASNGKVKGLADKVIEWCWSKHHNLRADTHHDNSIMQALLKRNGFEECGIIYVANGTPRIAYQRCDG